MPLVDRTGLSPRSAAALPAHTMTTTAHRSVLGTAAALASARRALADRLAVPRTPGTMERPTPTTPTTMVWQAIDIYLRHAYRLPPPRAVLLRLEALSARPAEDLYGG